MPSSGINTSFMLPCMYVLYLMAKLTNNAKLQRPIAPKPAGVSPHKLLESVTFSFSNGASLMILTYLVMELQPLKHTLLPPATDQEAATFEFVFCFAMWNSGICALGMGGIVSIG